MRLALACALLPGLAAGQGLDGTYAPDCADPASDSRLTIAGPEVRFHESTCILTDPVAVRGMSGAVLHDLACTGEGESWTRRILLMPGLDGGLVRVEEGLAWTYARCG